MTKKSTLTGGFSVVSQDGVSGNDALLADDLVLDERYGHSITKYEGAPSIEAPLSEVEQSIIDRLCAITPA